MNDGYWKKMLRIDLSNNTITNEDLSDETLRRLLGGVGLGTKVLLDEVGYDVDPLSPENRVIFSVGPLQATSITGSGKWMVTSKSPLTGILGFSAAGGDWGVNLKNAGYEAIVIQGKAKNPSYILIQDDQVEIKDASQIWGKDSYETVDLIRDQLEDPGISVAAIGQAGEKKVAIANIVADQHSFAGRCGLGAVMGAKNLKAIAIKGTKKANVNNLEKVRELVKNLGKKISKNASGMRELGTPGEIPKVNKQGDWPVKYWSEDYWEEGAERLSGTRYDEELTKKPVPCANCVLACHRDIEIEEPEKYALSGPGPEYEALGMLGSNLLIPDLAAISKANDLCRP